MNGITLSSAHEECLRNQVINGDQPGPVLHDFEMLLTFLGPNGVEASGKYNLLPIKHLAELDSRLSRPLELTLKRPQLRSHPHLQALNLLLRASGLAGVETRAGKDSLVLVPEMLARWETLNPTEQYFHLLETALVLGQPEMIGERGSRGADLCSDTVLGWLKLPEEGLSFERANSRLRYLPGFGDKLYLVALLDLFGIVKLEHYADPPSPWFPARITPTPFGKALMPLVIAQSQLGSLVYWSLAQGQAQTREDEEEPVQEEDDSESPFTVIGREGLEIHYEGAPAVSADEDEVDEDEPVEDEDDTFYKFGAWYPALQPYFPNLVRALELPESPARTGEFLFRVSLGKIWRRISAPAETTLEELADAILDSVDFDHDHLYEFRLRDELGRELTIGDPRSDFGELAAHEVDLAYLPLNPGQLMMFRFDFGDNWEFTVKLEAIEEAKTGGKGKRKGLRVVERHGKAPEQYPNWDE